MIDYIKPEFEVIMFGKENILCSSVGNSVETVTNNIKSNGSYDDANRVVADWNQMSTFN